MNSDEVGKAISKSDLIDQSDAPIFHSGPMRKLDALISRFARVDFDVLILGETGSGKDVVAHEIHRRSSRSSHHFAVLPIAGLCDTLIDSELFGHVSGAYSGALDAKPGKLEAAESGSIYIPEISDLSLRVQSKLLHFMQYRRLVRVGENPRDGERKCNVRLILASNENLEQCVQCGRMREDFYHRIRGLRIIVPPLRERRDAIPLLVEHILHKSETTGTERHAFSSEALDWLAKQIWPGNVRQLENLVRELIVTAESSTISREEAERCYRADGYGAIATTVTQEAARSLAAPIPTEGNTKYFPSWAEFTNSMQKQYLTALMQRSHGSISIAARISGLTSRGLRKTLKRLGSTYDPNNFNQNGQGGHTWRGGGQEP